MNEAAVVEIGRDAFFVILKVGGPILLGGLVVGLVIALFQTVTSIQEMTLTFVPKIVIVFALLVVMLPFMMNTVVEFGLVQFDRIISIEE